MQPKKVTKRHQRRAEMLATQFPDSLDDAIIVLGLLTEMLERAATRVDYCDLPVVSSMLQL